MQIFLRFFCGIWEIVGENDKNRLDFFDDSKKYCTFAAWKSINNNQKTYNNENCDITSKKLYRFSLRHHDDSFNGM